MISQPQSFLRALCRAARAADLQSLEWELEWTWTGHAILTPSFRVTFETVKKVYCLLSISAADTLALVDIVVRLERKPDGAMARSAIDEREPISVVPHRRDGAAGVYGAAEKLGRSRMAGGQKSQGRSRAQQQRSGHDLEPGQPAILVARRLLEALHARPTSIDNPESIG